ncbi:hypothetical protein FIBSPDRAFT_684954, partial [Athelia psychrophila]
DTGCTTHMTPHRHWLSNYSVHHVPVYWHDKSVLSSSGIGTCLFNPIINGKPSQQLTFIEVLHIPELEDNLFSILTL